MSDKPNDSRTDAPAGSQALARQTSGVITTNEQFKSALARWESEHYHVLTPATSFSGVGNGWGLVASMVQINPDPAAGEVYQDKLFCGEDEVALSKIGLSKIAQCAGLSFSTERMDDRRIQNLWEVRAIARFRSISGDLQEQPATVEYDLRDGSPRITKIVNAAKRAKPTPRDPSNQIDGMRMHGLRNAEARAINAATRGIGIRQKYKKAELQKPFVVVRAMFQPDMSDPEVRKLVAADAMRGTSTLYAGSEAREPVTHLPPIHDAIDGEIEDDGSAEDTSTQQGSDKPAQSTAGKIADTDNAPTPNATKVVEVKQDSGVSNGRKWTRWDVVMANGTQASTFSESVRDDALAAMHGKYWVDVVTEKKGNYENVTKIEKAQPALFANGDGY